MNLVVRRTLVIKSTQWGASGVVDTVPLEKLGIVFVVANPYAGTYVHDLAAMIAASVDVGRAMARVLGQHCDPHALQSYGKGGIVGLAGEQEHANALLTTAFADPVREAMGGAKAWISSVTKLGGPGTAIDVPMNHKNEVYVRSHYDAMSISLPDGPMPDEIALIFCFANRGRLNARVGGLSHEDVVRRAEAP